MSRKLSLSRDEVTLLQHPEKPEAETTQTMWDLMMRGWLVVTMATDDPERHPPALVWRARLTEKGEGIVRRFLPA